MGVNTIARIIHKDVSISWPDSSRSSLTWALLGLFMSSCNHCVPLPSISATNVGVRERVRDVAMTVCPPALHT